jgi:signal transduction histidine kinase
LHRLLNDLVALYTPRLRNKEIAVVRQFASRGSAYGRTGDLRQVFSNLLANAIDAVQDGGHLVIRTSDWRKAAQRSPQGLLVTIADDGCGIGVETKTRIFEPLFTTKDGVGTGLGLWVVSELVSKHGGWIKVRSKVQEGSVFSVFLPIHALGSVSSATVS